MRSFSKTVLKVMYGRNTFKSKAPDAIAVPRNVSAIQLLIAVKGRSSWGRKIGGRVCPASASAVVNSRKVCEDRPEERW